MAPIQQDDSHVFLSFYSGMQIVDDLVTVLLCISMFVGGVTAFFLDNTLPGTKSTVLSLRNLFKPVKNMIRAYMGTFKLKHL